MYYRRYLGNYQTGRGKHAGIVGRVRRAIYAALNSIDMATSKQRMKEFIKGYEKSGNVAKLVYLIGGSRADFEKDYSGDCYNR